MFFAATNSHASETSVGFCNTWCVLSFATKAARDNFVREATDCATRAITRKEVANYTERKPKPFTGEAYVIADQRAYDASPIDGYVGCVTVGDAECPGYIRHLNR